MGAAFATPLGGTWHLQRSGGPSRGGRSPTSTRSTATPGWPGPATVPTGSTPTPGPPPASAPPAPPAPAARLENLYGPTELTVTCTGYQLPANPADWPSTGNGTLPIGTLHPGAETLVVDERMRPADEGELLMRGPQRFPGYLDPADDAGRFFGGVLATGLEPYADGPLLTSA
ncbi:hypothetical protein GCM10027073_00740 [Streptomyces chlorus]